MNGPARLVLLTLLALPAIAARSAELFTENFTGGISGWTNSTSPNKWLPTNNQLRLTFNAGLPPLPQTAAIEGGPEASDEKFVGDFLAAGVEAVGFSFYCETVLPQDLKIELTSGTNIIFQELSDRLTGTGTWNHFLCPLTGPAANRWVGFAISQFDEILTNITRVAVRVLNNSSLSAQHYRLDDIFLDRLPAAAALTVSASNVTDSTWANLRTNFTYRLEQAATPTNAWSPVIAITATSTAHTLAHTNAAPDAPAFLRLIAP